MTTLPQTTSIHVPRTAPASVPAPYAPAGTALPSSQSPFTGADFWRMIRTRFWLIVICLALSSVGGFVAYKWFLQNAPRWTATGLLQVQTSYVVDPVRRQTSNLEGAQLLAELRTQAEIIRSEGTLAHLLKEGRAIRERAWYRQFLRRDAEGKEKVDSAAAKKELADDLRASPVPDSKLVRVEFTARDPKDAQIVLKELVDLHLDQQRRRISEDRAQETQMLQNLRDGYRTRVDQKKTDVEGIQRRMMQSGGVRIGERQDSLELELMRLLDERSRIEPDVREADAKWQNWQQQINSGVTPAMATEFARNDQRIRELEVRIEFERIARRTEALNKGDNHPAVLIMDARLKEMQDAYDKLLAELVVKARDNVGTQLRDAATQKMAALNANQEAINRIRDRLATINNLTLEFLTAQEDLRQTRELFRQVDDQLKDMTIISSLQSGSRVFWGLEPQEPESPSFPKPAIMMALAVFLGLALGLGIAFLAEVLNQTVRTPRDIQRVGQMNLLAIIPHESEDPEAANVPLPLVIFHAPHSVMAEHFRQMRTRLQHSAALDTTRSLMVTGPSPSDGKTTVACNLAAGLALNGRKILLVDANFRRPEIHHVFRVGNESGFADVLNGTVNFDDVVVETQVPNLSIMAAGPKPMNPAELFESQLLIDFIERALEEFDHVVFDSGPLLVVSESVAMAPRVDGVVTVVRAHVDSRGLLTRMRDELKKIKAEHLGVVLNAARTHKGGYFGRNIKAYYDYQNVGN